MIGVIGVVLYVVLGGVAGVSICQASLPARYGGEWNGYAFGMGVIILLLTLHPIVSTTLSNY